MEFESGNEKMAFICQTYSTRMKAIAYQYVQDMDLAEDATQEAFIDIMHSIDKISIEKGGKMPTLIGFIVKCKAIDIIRARKNLVLVEEFEESMLGFHCEEVGICETNQIYQIIQTMKERDRVILLLRLALDLDYQEIAKKLDISEANARKRYERARGRLQILLRKKGIYEE
ncbi:MAG: sigma-70 family RNA polymerase sigma factor [Tissierellia bacterium]|nr:sigma-70 family RNA polymerase sigma factor [Tissierellia bacterium]